MKSFDNVIEKNLIIFQIISLSPISLKKRTLTHEIIINSVLMLGFIYSLYLFVRAIFGSTVFFNEIIPSTLGSYFHLLFYILLFTSPLVAEIDSLRNRNNELKIILCLREVAKSIDKEFNCQINWCEVKYRGIYCTWNLIVFVILLQSTDLFQTNELFVPQFLCIVPGIIIIRMRYVQLTFYINLLRCFITTLCNLLTELSLCEKQDDINYRLMKIRKIYKELYMVHKLINKSFLTSIAYLILSLQVELVFNVYFNSQDIIGMKYIVRILIQIRNS